MALHLKIMVVALMAMRVSGALAQSATEPPQMTPEEQAMQQRILALTGDALNWQAQAIAYQRQITELQKQLAEAKKSSTETKP